MTNGISTSYSTNPDTTSAVTECLNQLKGEEWEFLLLFHGPNHSGKTLENALHSSCAGRAFGCSTVGEIRPGGYCENTLSVIGFGSDHFSCVAREIHNLGEFGQQQASRLIPAMKEELQHHAPGAADGNTIALLLIDSASRAEEFVAAALGRELGNIQLLGGSSGDNWQMVRSPVLYEGRCLDESAALLLVHTDLPFRIDNFHNFVPSDQRGVITSATATERLVHEINGAPAIQEYERLCGMKPGELDREHLALHPAIITVGDRAYPRGFAEILDDGSMRSACAIEEGVVFRVAAQLDYVQQMEASLQQVRAELGEPLLVLALECAARRQMVDQHDLREPVARLFSEFNVWGANCMGEQSNSLHVNNSFNCLAFALPT